MLFAVFDGIDSSDVSLFAKNNLKSILVGLLEYQQQDYAKALRKLFLELDEALKKQFEYQLKMV